MKIWDSFFALVILQNLFMVPLAYVFKDSFDIEGAADSSVNYKAFDLFIHMLWLIAFFINCNRVNFVLKIVTPYETIRAYFKSPFLIPDLVALVGAVACLFSNKHRMGKAFELIRILHVKEALYPAFLCV